MTDDVEKRRIIFSLVVMQLLLVDFERNEVNTRCWVAFHNSNYSFITCSFNKCAQTTIP